MRGVCARYKQVHRICSASDISCWKLPSSRSCLQSRNTFQDVWGFFFVCLVYCLKYIKLCYMVIKKKEVLFFFFRFHFNHKIKGNINKWYASKLLCFSSTTTWRRKITFYNKVFHFLKILQSASKCRDQTRSSQTYVKHNIYQFHTFPR